ncbi:MAG: HD domain-containing protein [Euryarchaeota archaeon]|nr:HD domain-containing protein [Euryarchaeota archaeon]
MAFRIPFNRNEKLRRVVSRIDQSEKVRAYIEAANTTAIARLGYNDHGYVHSKIVANLALKMLRVLVKHGLKPGVVRDFGLKEEDAEVVVVLASALHDVGMAVHRENHVEYGVVIAYPLLNELLEGLYGERDRAVVVSEVLHAIASHEVGVKPLTLEAGIVTIADALDMAGGRARIPFSRGKVDIHSVSAMAIEGVEVREGEDVPLRIKIKMGNSAGIFQIDELLKPRVLESGLREYLHIEAEIRGEEKRILERIEL